MIAKAISTKRIEPNSCTIFELLDEVLASMPEKSVLAITSKVISLCEGAVVPVADTDKEALIRSEAEYYMTEQKSKYGINFTIAGSTLIPNSGIDESNAGDVYVLWPRDAQATANAIREYLVKRFGVQEVGVVITDSTCRPMRLGVSGIALAFSGFTPLRNYVGQDDLFGRPFSVAQADIVGGLANTAVMMMGEGAESTPIALLGQLDFVQFMARNPSEAELGTLRIPLEDDLFAPFITSVTWMPGGRANSSK